MPHRKTGIMVTQLYQVFLQFVSHAAKQAGRVTPWTCFMDAEVRLTCLCLSWICTDKTVYLARSREDRQSVFSQKSLLTYSIAYSYFINHHQIPNYRREEKGNNNLRQFYDICDSRQNTIIIEPSNTRVPTDNSPKHLGSGAGVADVLPAIWGARDIIPNI